MILSIALFFYVFNDYELFITVNSCYKLHVYLHHKERYVVEGKDEL